MHSIELVQQTTFGSLSDYDEDSEDSEISTTSTVSTTTVASSDSGSPSESDSDTLPALVLLPGYGMAAASFFLALREFSHRSHRK